MLFEDDVVSRANEKLGAAGLEGAAEADAVLEANDNPAGFSAVLPLLFWAAKEGADATEAGLGFASRAFECNGTDWMGPKLNCSSSRLVALLDSF